MIFVVVCFFQSIAEAEKTPIAAYSFNRFDLVNNEIFDDLLAAKYTSSSSTTQFTSGHSGNGIRISSKEGFVISKFETGLVSISTWIRFSSLPANGAPAQLLIGRSNAYALLVVADNSAFRFQFSYFNILQKSSITIAVNTWYHVVGTYDAKSTSTKASIFINGVLSSLSNAMQASATVNDVIGDIIIGPMQQNLLVATLDDLRLYNVVLTAADALNDMNTPVTPSLIGAYSFDNTTPTSGLIDSSLYANHGAAVQVSNCAQTVAGRFGTAVRFNGVWRCSFAVDAAQYRLFGSMSFAAWLSPISFPQDDGDIISV